ncbi:MAG: preprotein translocase subunit YajC [Actinobacteria bacterium]|nr:preprotein translocase subunit YajC [Actinomycetota bacterium]
MAQLIVIVAMFVLLWLLFIRPQRQRVQAQQQLVSGIEVGDEILTVGGIYGRVLELRDEDELILEIAPGTQVRAARRAVAAVLPEDDEPQELENTRETEPNEEIRS